MNQWVLIIARNYKNELKPGLGRTTNSNLKASNKTNHEFRNASKISLNIKQNYQEIASKFFVKIRSITSESNKNPNQFLTHFSPKPKEKENISRGFQNKIIRESKQS